MFIGQSIKLYTPEPVFDGFSRPPSPSCSSPLTGTTSAPVSLRTGTLIPTPPPVPDGTEGRATTGVGGIRC